MAEDLPPVSAVERRDTLRLVSTARLKGPALGPLAADAATLDDLAALESVTNGRLQAQERGLEDLDPRELVFGRPGHSFINAAFTHPRPGGNRFNGEDRGAWYCAFEPATALAEVAWHLTRELDAIGRYENSTDYAELLADVNARFHDLRGADPEAEPALHPETQRGYPAGQALARRLRREAQSNGVVYPSVRVRGGTCLAVFRPDLVQNLRQGGILRLTWKGRPKPAVRRL